MFKSLTLKNFKSFAGEGQTIPFAPLTVFVGANGSGKSNVFDAVRFLQGLGSELTITEILTGKWEGGRDVHPGLRGGIEEACWRGAPSFEMVSKVALADSMRFHLAREVTTGQLHPTVPADEISSEPFDAVHSIVVDVNRDPLVARESLNRRVGDSSPIHVFGGACGNNESAVDGVRLSSGWWQNLSPKYCRTSILRTARNLGGFDEQWPIIANFLLTIASPQFLNLRPSAMRDYVPAGRPMLGEYGENLSAVAYGLCEDPVEQERFVEWLGAFCAPRVLDIDFDMTELGDVLAILIEADGNNRRISSRSLSDGTLRFMGILAALMTAPERSVFLLEEIENGLHPTRVHLLMELFEQFAAERNIQIIATTHSSQVLLSLSDEALRNAVLFARNEDHPGTVVRRLGDLPDFDAVTERRNIDELFTTGWLERAL